MEFDDFDVDEDESGYEYEPDEPDLDFQFEHDSAMESIGWGDSYAYSSSDEF